jgi:citrate lyase subunit beta/citryl-CoA lyase
VTTSTSAALDRLRTARSLLFAPGHDERKLRRALAGAADIVVADWEDSVPEASVDDAVAVTAAAFAEPRGIRLVRVREVEELRLGGMTIDGLLVPKATPERLRTAAAARLPLVALVETAAGLARLDEVARSERVVALMLGSVDLGLELDLQERDDGLELLYARSRLVLESACAGIRPPFDGVSVHVRDAARTRAECVLARSLGFGGKGCIHPGQVEIVNTVFSPTEEELAWAGRVLAAAESAEAQGVGAIEVDGKLVDRPVVERARRLVRRRPADR